MYTYRKRDGEQDIRGGERHEAVVAACVETCFDDLEPSEVFRAVEGAAEREGGVDRRDESDRDGPGGVQEKGEECVGVGLDAPDTF